MFEQMNTQTAALGKNYADTFVKAQGLALAGFERITELNLKAFEERVKASVEFWTEAAEVRDFEGLKSISEKGVQLAKESAEKLYANSQEVFGVSLKTSEALGRSSDVSRNSTPPSYTEGSEAISRSAIRSQARISTLPPQLRPSTTRSAFSQVQPVPGRVSGARVKVSGSAQSPSTSLQRAAGRSS